MHDQLYAHLIRSQLEPFAFNKWNTDDGVSMHEISKSNSLSSFPLTQREVYLIQFWMHTCDVINLESDERLSVI